MGIHIHAETVDADDHVDEAADRLLEYAALAESYSSHPISRSLKEAWHKSLEKRGQGITDARNQDFSAARVGDTEEISGKGVITEVDGQKVVNAVAEGSFTLARNETKKLTVAPSYTPSSEGGLKIVVTIDDSTNDKTINIEVPVTWI